MRGLLRSCDNTLTDVPTAAHGGARTGLGLLCVHPQLGLEPIPLQSVMTVGRGSDSSIVALSDTVSRHHARIELKGALWRCMDLGSRNGTYVNGQRITDVPIGPGDVIRFGDWLGVVVRLSSGRHDGFGRLGDDLYGGPVLRAALEPLERMARSSVHLVIEGETGSGKESVARAVHASGGRRGPYVAVNCAALPVSLAEAELFGYCRGAFTGAETNHPGHLRAADGGTLVLDEICELSLPIQAKLLRVLERREVTPLGASKAIPVDLRVVALAQRPLDVLVEEGRFRDDLRARLSVSLRIPPLRERVEDVPYLLDLFMRRATCAMPQIQARFLEALLLYAFPRNVRELEQLVVEQALLIGEVPLLRRSHLPAGVLSAARGMPSAQPKAASQRKEVDRGEGTDRRAGSMQDEARLQAALARNGGNVAQAARELGISRYQAYRVIKAHPEFSLGQFREKPSLATDGSG